MKKILFTLFSFIITVTSPVFAENAEEAIVCGNGNATVETTNSGKPHLSIGYKSLYRAFDIMLPDARIDHIAENEETGEIFATANAGKSHFSQKVITSRKDDAIIILLSSRDVPFTQKIRFSESNKKKNANAPRLRISTSANGANISGVFSNKPVVDNDNQIYGFETVVSVITDNGKTEASGEDITLTKCSQAIIIISSKQQSTLAKSHIEELTKANNSIAELTGLNKKKPNCEEAYDVLLKRHLENYTAACKSVSLMLNTGNKIDTEIANLYNNLYYKSIRSGESLAIETDNFTALPKLNSLVKNQIRASFLFDYYLYTLDTDFLEQKVLPLMLSTYEDLEKTLKTTDDFGFYIIAKDDPAFEVSVAIFFLRDFVTTCNILMAHQEKVPRLQEILAKLPPYKIDINEEFRRRLYGESANENKYSDVPQLYGLFYRNDPIITRNYDIREACKATIKSCMEFRSNNNIKGIDQGFLQLALSSAALGDGNTSYKLLTDAHSNWKKASSSELVPIIKKMLVQSYYSPESSKCYLNILPAIPDQWTNGELSGMLVRGGITMPELKWNEDGEITATMQSKTDVTLDVYIRGRFVKSVNLSANTPFNLHAKKRD